MANPPKEYPIRVGSMLFVLTDPGVGHEVEYNRWYERDHFYAGCMIGPWLFAGRRWVATRDLKDLRFRDGLVARPESTRGSYVAIYWIHRRPRRRARRLGHRAGQLAVRARTGASPTARTSHTWMYMDVCALATATTTRPALELALDQPAYTGAVSLVVRTRRRRGNRTR